MERGNDRSNEHPFTSCHARVMSARGKPVDCPAFKVVEIDPTGAGDCFGGAYVACRRLGMPALKALDYANAAGARNVTMQGPMEGAGSRRQLDEFIAVTRVPLSGTRSCVYLRAFQPGSFPRAKLGATNYAASPFDLQPANTPYPDLCGLAKIR